jgi:hypothetical protein
VPKSTSLRGLGTLALIGVIATPAMLKLLGAPFVWIFGLWTVLAFVGLRLTGNANLRALCVNFGVAMFVLGAAEAFLWMQSASAKPKSASAQTAEHREGAYARSGGYFDRAHPILGYAPIKGVAADSRLYYGDELVYDVTYTIDDDGLRVSPPAREDAPGCILFFGCSFTIGEGVRDEETLPYRVGVLTHGEHRVYNFGFHGYGPHQMLAALESGMVSKIIKCRPRHVFYQALDRHVLRSSGVVEWDKVGPRYVAAEGGTVVRAGSFADTPSSVRVGNSFTRQLAKSHIYTKIIGSTQSSQVRDKDLHLFGGIVEAARRQVAAMNPEAQFHVLLWTFDPPLTRRVVDELASRHIQPYFVRDALPEGDYRKVYAIGPHDHHPSAKTYDLVARYVVTEIIDKPRSVQTRN